MKEEDLIRALVASPADDAPRLKYAAWLEERSDPRAAFLRAEMAWAKPWRDGECPRESRRLLELAIGLPPTWVARVSRPPLGACCEHVRFRSRATPPERGRFKEVEEAGGFRIPVHYRALLLNYAGGDFTPNTLRRPRADGWPPEPEEDVVVLRPGFAPLDRLGAELVFDTDWGRLLWVAGRERGEPEDATLFLGVDRRQKGRVYLGSGAVSEEMDVIEVGPSLGAFLCLLEPLELEGAGKSAAH
jgi:uncharacterized protein (TIGR02996 family)